jgi:uncharacterized protein YqeY
MTLINTIKRDQLESRKNRDKLKASLLTTLLGEAMAIGKTDGNRETTDPEVIALIKKFVKNIGLSLEVAEGEAKSNLEAEKQILTQYLPQQMSEEEITTVVQNIINIQGLDASPRNIGVVMKSLREGFEGQYDAKLASNIVKACLS